MGLPIDKITLKGYKSIRSQEIPLRNLNILIGPNGAGKSNFVSFFTFLRELVEERLGPYVARNGGADRFLFMGPKVTLDVTAQLRFHSFGYGVDLTSSSDVTFVLTDEVIGHYSPEGSVRKGSIIQGYKGATWTESVLKQRARDTELPDMDRQVCKDIYDSISGFVVYHMHDTGGRAWMRRKCRRRDNEYLRSSGENLAAFLLMLRDEQPNAYEKIRDTVRLAAPFFDDFKLRPEAANGDEELQLEWTQRGSDYPFHVNQLSDGTLRFIALATALLQPDPPATMLFDEPELGLHPYALNLFAALVKKAAVKTQVIVSTQSALLLDNFEPEDIIVVERKEGESVFRRLSSSDLTEWLKEYSLGELWQKNVIGGRPSNG